MAKLDRANDLLRKLLRQYTHFVYGRKLHRLRKVSPSLFNPRSPKKEERHLSLWRELCPNVDIGWFRFFANLSNRDDPNFVPDNLYHAIIEKILNDVNYAWVFADKNFYQRHFDERHFPRTYLRNVAGTFLDEGYRPISERVARTRFLGIASDVIVKPSVDSNSGHKVHKLSYANQKYFLDSESIDWHGLTSLYGDNFLVQETVSQHPALARLNPSSVNTLRVFTYRSVTDNRVHVCTNILRIGRAGRNVDNGHMGGLICGVDSNGRISSRAATVDGKVYGEHPEHSYGFGGLRYPCLRRAHEICRSVAAEVYSNRTLSFDVTVTEESVPLIIEINTFGQGAHASQFFTSGLFGQFTREVIDYCNQHAHKDHFKILRLFG